MVAQHWYGLALLPLVSSLNLVMPMVENPLMRNQVVSSPIGTIAATEVKARKSGGFRCSCFRSGKRLIALRPDGNNAWKTSQEYPTLFIYVPKAGARVGLLTLQDETTRGKTQDITVPLPDKPGILRLDLAVIAKNLPLQVGHTYYWTFGPICNKVSRPMR